MEKEVNGTTLGVIVGNRGFFPDHLCATGRETMLRVLEKEGIKTISLTPKDTPFGSVESLSDAQKCADLFKAHRDEIDGVVVTLPNFGDERAIANTLRWAELNVPVLIQAFPDEPTEMTIANRRDSFCGKMSACNNLKQYGIPFTLTELHTVDPESESFGADLARFVAICRVVRGLKNARLGARSNKLGDLLSHIDYKAPRLHRAVHDARGVVALMLFLLKREKRVTTNAAAYRLIEKRAVAIVRTLPAYQAGRILSDRENGP